MADTRSSYSAMALWILAIVALVLFLRAASQLFIPVTLAVLISYALEPVVAWLSRHHVPRLAGTSAVLLLILGMSAWGVVSLKDDVLQATEALPKAAARVREMVGEQGASGPAAHVREAAEELGASEAAPAGSGEQQSSPPSVAPAGSTMIGFLQQGVTAVMALAGHLVVIVFLVFFLLLSGSHFRERIVEVAGPSLQRRRVTASIIDDINAQVQRFLLVRLLTAAVVALATWAVLAWMEVPQAAVWGILAGVFNSIPYFGPVIVSGGLLLVGLVQGGGVTEALKMSGAALAITSLEGWLLTPPLLGKAERMNALVVFLGLLVWTWIWGAWGTILAVPMLVMVKSVADHVESLKPVSRLMAP